MECDTEVATAFGALLGIVFMVSCLLIALAIKNLTGK